jgi:hypothetical protein
MIQIPKFNLGELRRPDIRVMIAGGSGTGKTTYFQKIIYPKIHDIFHVIYIITMEDNYQGYVDMLPKENYIVEELNGQQTLTQVPKVIFKFPKSALEIDVCIDQLMKFQNDTKKKYNVLLIYDDIFSTKLKKSDTFITQFTTFRHHNIAVYFIIQTFTSIFSSTILGQMSYIICFRMNDPYFINYMVRTFTIPGIVKAHTDYYIDQFEKTKGKTGVEPVIEDRQLKMIAKTILAQNLMVKKYGALIFNRETNDMYIN